MTRSYWYDAPSSWAEGYSLDAALCRDSIIGNAESVLDESGWDHCVVLPEVETCGEGWYLGPMPLLLRFDRDGLCRGLGVNVLASGGSDLSTLRAYLTPVYRAPVTTDILATWDVADDAETSWQTEATLTLPRHAVPDQRRHRESATSDRWTRSRIVYLTFQWESAEFSPLFSGYSVRELVRV